jgi:hypothetical protein
VAGLRRDQVVMLDLATSPVAVSGWATTRYQQQCAAVFATYMRDVDVSPDGSYFVVVTTGAYRAGSLCDAAATGPGQQPTWVDCTGGDTLYSVAVTGTAVYVGGHQRWMNNSFAGDRAGPGAVAREGIAALDPVSGLPCPGTRGATAAWASSPWSPPPRASGSAATPSASAATSTTAASPSCPGRRHRGARVPGRRLPGGLFRLGLTAPWLATPSPAPPPALRRRWPPAPTGRPSAAPSRSAAASTPATPTAP